MPIDYSRTAGAGFENMSASDQTIPYLIICQDNSAQYKKTHPDYAAKAIDGIEPGDIFNSATQEIVCKAGTKLRVIPCFHKNSWIEWRPRSAGGGMENVYHTDDILAQTTKNEKNKDVLPNGNTIEFNINYLCLYERAEDDFIPAMVSMSGGSLKIARQWNSKMNSIVIDTGEAKFTPAMFSHTYLLSTFPDNNPEGSWMNWKVELDKIIEDETIFIQAEQLNRGQQKQLTNSENTE